MWNTDGAPLSPAVLERMDATLAHRGPDGGDRCIAGAVGFAHRRMWITPEEVGERQPLNEQGLLLAWDGRLDNRPELISKLGLSSSSTDARVVLAAYARLGDSFVDHLSGDFALALYDSARARLILARDAIGIRPLYYHRGKRFVAFATEIKALLAHPEIRAAPDDEGLADFLLVGARPVDRQDVTCFAGISAVVPAHVVTVTTDAAVARRYWDFDPSAAIRLSRFEEYRDAFAELFAQAVARRVRSAYPVAVSTSGGLDSSSIFCQAQKLRTGSVLGFAYLGATGSDADEREYLEEIEREYGVSIGRFPMEVHAGALAGVETQVGAIEAPFLDYQWGVTCELDARAGRAGARVMLSGHWGDQVLFSPAYLVDLVSRFAWRKAWSHTREYLRWFGREEVATLRGRLPMELLRHHAPDALVGPLKWVRRRLFADARPRSWYSDRFLAGGLKDADRPAMLGSGFHSAQARSLYLEARSKYHVQCMEWNNKIAASHGLEAAFPFLDRDLLAFLMAIPGEVQNHEGVPRAILREAMRGILPERVRARRWKADFTEATNHGVAQDLAAIRARLGPGSLGVRMGYVDGGRLQPAVDRMAAGLAGKEATDGWDLVDLLGLEAWLRVFFSRSQMEVRS